MKYDLIIVSSENLDSSPSIVFSFEDNIYIFNTPDQTQRLFKETKTKLSRLKHTFFTSLDSKSIGGFYGLFITLFDVRGVNVSVSGPSNMESILETFQLLHSQENLRPIFIKNFSDQNITTNEIILFKSICYEVKLKDIPGKFLIQKAKDLGISPGPVYREFTSGKSVKLDDGRIINPEDVIGPSTPGDFVLIIDCICQEDINMLNINLDKYDFIVHFTPIEILLTTNYLSKFDCSKKGICFSPNGNITFNSISILYSSIVNLSPNLFKPLSTKKFEFEIPKNLISSIPGLIYTFSPPEKKNFIFPKNISLNFEEFNYELPKFSSFVVTFLGTGSMYPSKYRNVAGILIHTKSGFILLDCGEGTLGQLKRRFGIENTNIILKNLIFIYISHIHGDHQFGLYTLLQYRSKISNIKVPLICHPSILKHLQTVESFTNSLYFQYYSDESSIYLFNSIKIEIIPVIHCKKSTSCVLNVDGGYRIAYSGDRGNLDNFPELVSSCDLLIHEATFSDDLKDIAKEKRHSTIGQAIQSGITSNSKYIILTHFSQRYPKLPVFENELNNVAFAFDYLSFKFEDIQELCSICPQIFQMILELEEKENSTEN